MTKLTGMKAAAAGLVCIAGALGALTYGCSDDPATTNPKTDAGGATDAAKDTGSTPADTGTPSDTGTPGDTGADTSTTPTVAATIAAMTTDGGATGTATFVETNGQVAVTLTVDGPPGLHGVHIHEIGSCASAGAAAGSHFNPGDAGHGLPDGATHHAGDLGNISLNDAGKGTLSVMTSALSVGDGGTSVVGRAIIVHENTDDGTSGSPGTGPGNSGARIGCGVIQRSN